MTTGLRMIRFYLPFCLLVATFNVSFGQNYYDSLQKSINSLGQAQKVDAINAIPFDKMNANPGKAVLLYKEALEISTKLNDAQRIAATNENLSIAAYYGGDYDEAVDYALSAIKQYKALKNDVKVGRLYASLGYQMKRRNLPKAFEYMRKGVSILEKQNSRAALSEAYNNFGVLYEMDNDIDSALHFYYLGLEIVESLNDSIGIPYSLTNIAGALVIKKNFERAKPMYDRALEIREKRNDLNGIAECFTYYGDFYFKQNLFHHAISYYQQSFELADSIHYPYLLKENSQQLSKCYENMGDYKNALKFQNISTAWKDSLINESTNRTIQHLELKFETEQKEAQIASQKVKLNEEALRINKRNNLIIGLASLLLLLIVLSFYIYRQQRFKRLQIIEENRLKDELRKVTIQNELFSERQRISRDLHDNIGSQLTFIISAVDNLKYAPVQNEKLIHSKLTDVSDFSRNTISQLRDTIWALNTDEITFEDLTMRLRRYLEMADKIQDDVRVTFDVKDDLHYLLTSLQGISIYRIIQESVNNAIKHANAKHIDVQIKEGTKHIEIEIKDDGKGFDVDDKYIGNGLKNMRLRAKEVLAEIKFESYTGVGTTVLITLEKRKLNEISNMTYGD